MTTVTPLSLPFVLKQNDPASNSNRRRWKPDRPSYRALLNPNHSKSSSGERLSSSASRAQNSIKTATPVIDYGQLEADAQEWGLPFSPSASKLAAPTSALSWDENSAQTSYSYLQSERLTYPTWAVSLDQWDPSISFAPYAFNGLFPTDLQQKTASTVHPTTYDPSLGRIVLVGRDDGTVSVYRAYGRVEDYDSLSSKDQQLCTTEDSLPASASASANLSQQLSRSASRRSSDVSTPSRLRSPDVEASSIRLTSSVATKPISSSSHEPSSFLNTFLHVDRSSLATRSIISAASISSTVAANVQIDEGLPVNSLM